MLFEHIHPYDPFIPDSAIKLIVGTLPPPRFSTGLLKKGDVNFCYGSIDGQLWPILDSLFCLDLSYEDTESAIEQRKRFLARRGIGICDIVGSAKREKIDASDVGMRDIILRDLIRVLKDHVTIETLLFTGGNSKNGPEFLFRRHLKTYDIQLKPVSENIPRIHKFMLPDSNRVIKTVSLTAPSGAANRAVGSLAEYQQMKRNDPSKNTIDFRIQQYRPFF